MKYIPTYLMVKRHCQTGMKYLCKTTRANPIRYLGSGRHWRRHLKQHGKLVETIWCKLYEDRDELINTAMYLSGHYDVVNSKEWANEIPEDGLQGGQNRGLPSPMKGKRNPKVSVALTGRSRPDHSALMKGRKQTAEHVQKRTVNSKEKGSCPHCGMVGQLVAMKRWHYDKCKERKI